jgi:hypothetical protein
MTIGPSDDLVSLLTQDHAAIRQRLDEISDAADDSRAELFWKLTDQLVRHEIGEELVVYPVLRESLDGAGVADARQQEEAEAETLLASMEDFDPSSDEFAAALRQLKEAVEDHSQREESEAFPLLLAHENSSSLIYLGQKFKGAKLAAPNHPHPHMPSNTTAKKVLGPIAAFFDRMRDEAKRSA